MATDDTSLPPMAKVSMICIWMETVLYGVNCVLYGLSMFILLRGGRVAPLRRVLVVMTTILFLLCTAHVGASFQQLLEAYVYVPANVPNYPTIYWLNNVSKMAVFKYYLYDALVLAQYSILIWRLYVVFLCDWRVVILPTILVVALVGTLCTVSVLSAIPNASLHSKLVASLIESAWVLDMLLNVPVTVAIAARLWWMGRKVGASVTTQGNKYASSSYVVVESGAILLVTNIVILALYVTNSPASFTILDVASQLAGLVPFLIVVQVALTGRYSIRCTSHGQDSGISTTVLTQQGALVFQPGNHEEQNWGQDVPLRSVVKLSHSESRPSDVA